MAEVKFSGVGVVDMNGSVGNMTFARNFYGAYAKTRIGAPVATSWLIAWQTEVASLVNVWEFGLSETDRQLWYTVARQKKDSMADTNQITGFDLYMSVNLNLFLAASAPVIAPPAPSPLIQCGQPVIVSCTPTVFNINVPGHFADTLLFYATKNLPPGRMSFNQIYGFSAPYNNTGGVTNFNAAWNFRFGLRITGHKIFVKFVPINSSTGERGIAQYASVIVS